MHPVLFPFGSEERWISFLSHWVTSDEHELEIAKLLVRKNILPLVHGSELAYILGISPKLLTHMAKRPAKYYRTFTIPKKTGKPRQITAPRIFLKVVQRYILDCVLRPLPVHVAACGFVAGRNCGSGAALHVGRRYVWNIDLKDFFPSVSQERVRLLFSHIGYQSEEHTSELISNLVFVECDSEIVACARTNNVAYTRYADDLTFSSGEPFSDAFINAVRSSIKKHGFRINERKTRLMGSMCRREVTGLTVNEKVSIPRYRRRQLRALFHQVELNPAKFQPQKRVVIGFASWVHDYHEEGKGYLKLAHSIPDPESRA